MGTECGQLSVITCCSAHITNKQLWPGKTNRGCDQIILRHKSSLWGNTLLSHILTSYRLLLRGVSRNELVLLLSRCYSMYRVIVCSPLCCRRVASGGIHSKSGPRSNDSLSHYPGRPRAVVTKEPGKCGVKRTKRDVLSSIFLSCEKIKATCLMFSKHHQINLERWNKKTKRLSSIN